MTEVSKSSLHLGSKVVFEKKKGKDLHEHGQLKMRGRGELWPLKGGAPPTYNREGNEFGRLGLVKLVKAIT